MQGRTIIVTGAFGALGSAVAQAAEDKGARVARIDISAPPGDGRALNYGRVDLTSLTDAQRVMDDIQTKAGPVHGLINIAGGFRWQTLADGDVDSWERMFTLNLKTAVVASKAALPHLIASGDGRIVNVGALGAVKAAAGMGAYAASKAGVAKLTESLAEELKDQGVTVNAVLPSIIDTPANRKDMPNADFSKWVSPQQLASVILFLMSAEARAVTGALVPVSGRV